MLITVIYEVLNRMNNAHTGMILPPSAAAIACNDEQVVTCDLYLLARSSTVFRAAIDAEIGEYAPEKRSLQALKVPLCEPDKEWSKS